MLTHFGQLLDPKHKFSKLIFALKPRAAHAML